MEEYTVKGTVSADSIAVEAFFDINKAYRKPSIITLQRIEKNSRESGNQNEGVVCPQRRGVKIKSFIWLAYLAAVLFGKTCGYRLKLAIGGSIDIWVTIQRKEFDQVASDTGN